MYHMTQSHHMTSQTTASADPGDALNLRRLGGAEKRVTKKNLLGVKSFLNSIAPNDHTEPNGLCHNLGELFRRPAKFEKPWYLTTL